MTYQRMKEHLEKKYQRKFRYRAIVQLSVVKNKWRQSAKRYWGAAKIICRRACKGFKSRCSLEFFLLQRNGQKGNKSLILSYLSGLVESITQLLYLGNKGLFWPFCIQMYKQRSLKVMMMDSGICVKNQYMGMFPKTIL